MRLLLSLSFIFSLAYSVSAKKTDVRIEVVNVLEEPVSGLEVQLESGEIMMTDASGIVDFKKVSFGVKNHLKFSINGGESYVDYENQLSYDQEKAHYTVILSWSDEGWNQNLSKYYAVTKDVREAMVDTMDFTNYVDCDDTTGEHHFLDAEFYGGHKSMTRFINSNVKYPQISVEMEEQGKVYLSFVVEADGRISTIDIERGVSKDLDREAKRVIRLMKYWCPAYCNGEAVRSKAYLPIVFTLQ